MSVKSEAARYDIAGHQQLMRAFADFQDKAERLSSAYSAMQEDFRRINIELDHKNKELAESLARQEEVQLYLNSILESMESGVISVDNNGMITQFNHAAAEITGYSAESVLGKSYSEVFSGPALTSVNVNNVLATGVEQSRDEKVIWRRDGNPVPVLFQCALLRDAGGRQLGAVELFSDLSRIKAMEQEMQQQKTMAALGEMAATVAHEIRNPLGAMGLWAGLLERDLDKSDPRRSTLHKITDALAQLNRIVSNLLVYSRPVHAKMHTICLQEAITEVINFMEIEADRCDRQISVSAVWDPKSPVYVTADPEKLQQVLMNLCFNAIQAMPAGGILTVSCAGPERKAKAYASFSITDTGIGIAKESLDKIFDPFYTTKENGTGLGLAIVKKFVEFHNGHINVKSRVNEGTTVQVFLPFCGEKR